MCAADHAISRAAPTQLRPCTAAAATLEPMLSPTQRYCFEVEGFLLLQDIGVTGQAFQYDPRARLAPASQPAAAVTRPLHSINL